MKVLVLPAVLEDVPEHAPDQRNVGRRPDPYILGRVRRRAGEARIATIRCAAVDLLPAGVLHRDRMRLGRVRADEDDRLGVADVVVGVGHGAVAPGVGDARDRRRVADARLVVDRVGAPERAELAEQVGALVGELGRAEQVDRSRRRLLADRPASSSPISSIAWSQEMRSHSPSTIFIGYFSRRSPCTSSRIAAPLAQCVPRLIGLSQAGSWPTQTPFCTSAMTVQPTEQWVQMFFLTRYRARRVDEAGLGPAHRSRSPSRRGEAADREPRAVQEAAAVDGAGARGPPRRPGACCGWLAVLALDQHGGVLLRRLVAVGRSKVLHVRGFSW